MPQPILHFIHANSFPAGTYRLFFDQLRTDYDVRALPMHAHNPQYPVRDGWHELLLELADELQAQYDQPVILVGHSFGGILGLMLAAVRPDLVRCVVMLDSPVVAGWRALLLRGAKKLGVDKKFSPAQFSEKRRKFWPDIDSAYQHYASKPMFAAWAPEVLQDYLDCGLEPHAEGVTLRFTREIESAVYLSLPDHVGSLMRRGLRVPVGFVGGRESVECRQAGMAATRRLVGRRIEMLPGGHLFPMETPVAAAQATHRMIESLLPG